MDGRATFVFDGDGEDLLTWKAADPAAARRIWGSKTERRRLSTFAEEFFRRLAARLPGPMLLRKGALHRLVRLVDPATIPLEVKDKLDLLAQLFEHPPPVGS